MDSDVEVLITDWFRRARESQQVHYACATGFGRLHFALGIPTIALTAAVGTAVFASLESSPSGPMRVAIGLVSMLATVLASLQTFLGFARRAESHRTTAAAYGTIRRSLEHIKTFPPASDHDLQNKVASIQQRMDAVAEASPHVPASKWKLVADLKRKGHKRIFSLPASEQAE